MWASPRNVSTAMMYAWAQRPDTTVWDEPMYGNFLEVTGIEHPMREKSSLQRQPTRLHAQCAPLYDRLTEYAI